MSPALPTRASELEATIGRLVREALHRQRTSTAGETAGGDRYSIGDSIVSLQVLEGLPEGVRRVEIGSRAVVTPAAADLLRHQQIQLIRVDRSRSEPTATGPRNPDLRRWVADIDHPQRAAGYVRQLAGRGLSAATVHLPLPSTADLSKAVGVVVAELPALQVDHFARILSLSAAAVGSVTEVARIAAAMTPAIWVLDAERLSISGRIAVAAECFRLTTSASNPPSTDPQRAAPWGRPR